MIFSKELEKLAEEEYPPLYIQSSVDENLGKRIAYIQGAAALENLIMKSGSEFNETECIEEFNKKPPYLCGQPCEHSYVEGARYKHESDKLIIGGLRARRESTKAMLDLTVEEIQKLESQIAELNKNCISLYLHESRMKEADKMYYALDNMYLDLNEKYEALKKVVDEIRHVRGEK